MSNANPSSVGVYNPKNNAFVVMANSGKIAPQEFVGIFQRLGI